MTIVIFKEKALHNCRPGHCKETSDEAILFAGNIPLEQNEKL